MQDETTLDALYQTAIDKDNGPLVSLLVQQKVRICTSCILILGPPGTIDSTRYDLRKSPALLRCVGSCSSTQVSLLDVSEALHAQGIAPSSATVAVQSLICHCYLSCRAALSVASSCTT